MEGDGSRPVRKIYEVSQISGRPISQKLWRDVSRGCHGPRSRKQRSHQIEQEVLPRTCPWRHRQKVEKEGLSRVTLTEPGLTWRKEIIHVQIVKQLTSYQFFNNSRTESNISYRSIARWNRWVKSRLLNNRCDDRALLGRRENSFTKRGVAQQSEER